MNAYSKAQFDAMAERERRRRRTRNEILRRKFIEQRVMGFAMVSIGIILMVALSRANEDGTAAVLITGFGLYQLFTKHLIIV